MAIPATTISAYAPCTFRHELKHQVNHAEARVLSARLALLFGRDAHAGPDGTYRITSLYFDTPYDEALRQKIEGIDRREKFRLRYYGGAPSFVKLEKKIKQGGLCSKRSSRLTLGEARRIIEGDTAFLLESDDPLKVELYSKMRGKLLAPRIVTAYDREAYTYAPGNCRITIDRNLRSATPEHFLDAAFSLPVNDGVVVVEVKYDAFLPDIVRMAVQIPNRRHAAYSKYAMCRKFG